MAYWFLQRIWFFVFIPAVSLKYKKEVIYQLKKEIKRDKNNKRQIEKKERQKVDIWMSKK